MLIEIYILFQIITIVLFATSFFTKQEILWALTSVFSGVMMYASWHIEYYIYEFNATLGAYQPVYIGGSYPYLMAINMVFFSLALVLGIFDLFDKYGARFAGKKGKEE